MSKRGVHHGRADHESEPSLKWLESQPSVLKLILGRSESCRHKYKPGTIRVTTEAPGGFKIKVYGGVGVIDGYVKVADEDKEELAERIKERFAV